MTNLNCIIIDDEPLACKLLSAYVEKLQHLNLVGTCSNALEAHQLIKQHEIDLAFLDIQMPDLTGLDFLRSLSTPPMIIFTTAYTDYALQAFELDVIDYLVKPIPFERFFKAVNKATAKKTASLNQENNRQANHEETKTNSEAEKNSTLPPPYIFVKSDYKIVKISFNNILFIQSLGDYVKIYTQTDVVLTLQSLAKFEEILPQQNFFRVHRSYIVNIDKIESIEGNMLTIGKHVITISKRTKKDFLEAINTHGLL